MAKELEFGLVPEDQIEWTKIREAFETTPDTIEVLAERFGIPLDRLKKEIEVRKWVAPLAPAQAADWELIKAAFEMTVEPLATLSLRYGVPRTEIIRRAAADKWVDPRKEVNAEGGLTPQQAKFVEEYLLDMNPANASRRSGLTPSTGNNWLKNSPAITEAISQAVAERSVRIGIDQDRVLQELAALALANMTDYASWDGQGNIRPKASKELTRAQAAGIVEISQGRNGVKIKLDKMPALNAVAKHLGMFIERTENLHIADIVITEADNAL